MFTISTDKLKDALKKENRFLDNYQRAIGANIAFLENSKQAFLKLKESPDNKNKDSLFRIYEIIFENHSSITKLRKRDIDNKILELKNEFNFIEREIINNLTTLEYIIK
jgi:hypothetical protein